MILGQNTDNPAYILFHIILGVFLLEDEQEQEKTNRRALNVRGQSQVPQLIMVWFLAPVQDGVLKGKIAIKVINEHL